MSVRRHLATGLAMAAFTAALALPGAVLADPPASGAEAPVGLEKLRKKASPSAPISEGGAGEPQEKPPAAKSLGHGPEDGAGSYTPGAPSGDRGARPETIGGGTRMKGGAASALDDIR